MYKPACIFALLLAILAFTFGRGAAGASSSGTTVPVIVAQGKLVDQSTATRIIEIFTPNQTGLYRVSVYMTMTRAGDSDDFWQFNLFWRDDAGFESAPIMGIFSNGTPPNDYGYSDSFSPAFEAVAGQPVSYQITGQSGEYSVYYTVERLQ